MTIIQISTHWMTWTKKIGPNWYKHYNLIGNYPHEHSRVLFCILKCWTLKPQALVITTILEEYRVCTADGKNRPIEKQNTDILTSIRKLQKNKEDDTEEVVKDKVKKSNITWFRWK